MLAYPEGETFFRRSSLTHGGKDWNFNAENENQFYQHALVEYVSNTAFSGGRQEQTYSHKRATYECKRAQGGYLTYFCYFNDMPISYGEPTYPNRRQTVKCEANPNVYRDRDSGGGIRVKIAHVQLPTKAERYMWIDMVQPIRAIYFPIAWKSDESSRPLITGSNSSGDHTSGRALYLGCSKTLSRVLSAWYQPSDRSCLSHFR